MAEYNAPFFGLFTTVYLQLQEKHGNEEALAFMGDVFAARLGPIYDELGFEKGNPDDFARVVGTNDERLGLEVEFQVEPTRIVYRFKTDPVPDLRGKVNPHELDATYMRFKVDYLLGGDWSYHTPKHIWNGDPFTEHVIEKS